MFTGLVTDVGRLAHAEGSGDVRLVVETGYDTSAIEIGASVACNGICLTVVDKADGRLSFDASQETCRVTTLGDWTIGQDINLERSLRLGDEMGGHIVSGHVDCVGTVVEAVEVGDSIRLDIEVASSHGHLLAAKGSVAVDGISLTVNTVTDANDVTRFSLNIIPHTQSVTSLRSLSAPQSVNIEFDLLARYVARLKEHG